MNKDRKDQSEKVRKAGYDIEDVALKYTNLILNEYKKI